MVVLQWLDGEAAAKVTADGSLALTYPAEGVELTVFRRGVSAEADEALEHAACLAMRARSDDEWSVCLQVAFFETGQRERGDDPTMRAVFGLLPGVDVTVPFDLAWLDGQTLFAPRTLGRLKMTIFGKQLKREDIDSIVISATSSFDGRRLTLWPCALLDEMPAIEIASRPLADELGQWAVRDWPGKVAGREACSRVMRELAGSDSDLRGGDWSDVEFGSASPEVGMGGKGTGQVSAGGVAAATADTVGKQPETNAGPHPYAAFAGWDRFGGWTGKRFEATGWFRVERETNPDGTPGRFWLVDPEGNAFISTGVDCVGAGVETRVDPVAPWLDEHVAGLLGKAVKAAAAQREAAGEGDGDADVYAGRPQHKPNVDPTDPSFMWRADPNGCNGVNAFYDYGQANLRAAFGDGWLAAWRRITRRHLTSWGVNTIGNWSDPGFIRAAGLPYVLPAENQSEIGFPSTSTMLFRDFPDVFAEEYAEQSERYAEGMIPWRDDPNLIGYFMRNEPNWAFVYDLNIAEEMLANPADLASKHAFVDWLRERYHGDAGAWAEAWGTAEYNDFEDVIQSPRFRMTTAVPCCVDDLKAFSRLMIDRYVRVPAEALRRVDPNHLNLGMRYAYITDEDLLAGSDCYDVFSINSYQRTCLGQVEKVGEMLDMPVMVGEFHHGATDMGLTAHGIRGVASQAERGVAYRYYVEQAATSPYFVGAHYFQYNDQSPLGRFDGENYQIGLVDVCQQEYRDMADAMRACHRTLYEVADGQVPPFDQVPQEVNPIHY